MHRWLTLRPVSWTGVTARWGPFTSYKRNNQVHMRACCFHMQHAVFLQCVHEVWLLKNNYWSLTQLQQQQMLSWLSHKR